MNSIKWVEKIDEVRAKHYINGKFVESIGGKPFDVFNPATEDIIAQAV